MAKSTVRWFNSRKGYGYIQSQGGDGADIFVHIWWSRGLASAG